MAGPSHPRLDPFSDAFHDVFSSPRLLPLSAEQAEPSSCGELRPCATARGSGIPVAVSHHSIRPTFDQSALETLLDLGSRQTRPRTRGSRAELFYHLCNTTTKRLRDAM